MSEHRKRTMRPGRLDALADGIFAIVMTLLVLEIRVPELHGEISNAALWDVLRTYGPLAISYVLSFAVLFTYWRAHHYIMGIYAKTVDVRLMNINALFFLFVAFIPFSAAILGTYSTTQVAIILYSINIILIGLTLWWMRHHVLAADAIENEDLTETELRHGSVRTLVPVIFAILAIPLSFWNPWISVGLLALAVLFNLSAQSTKVTDALF